MLGLLLSIILVLWWISKQPLNPAGTVRLFCVLGLVLGSPYYLREAYGFARTLSPRIHCSEDQFLPNRPRELATREHPPHDPTCFRSARVQLRDAFLYGLIDYPDHAGPLSAS